MYGDYDYTSEAADYMGFIPSVDLTGIKLPSVQTEVRLSTGVWVALGLVLVVVIGVFGNLPKLFKR